MSIERLRALEKEYRPTMNVDVLHAWAEDVTKAIAELGQEVEAVEPAWFYVRTPGADYDYTFTKTREEAIDLQDCDEPDEPIPLYASPAHTSEARDAIDAARYRFIAADRSAAWEEELDAAMRQEGGTP